MIKLGYKASAEQFAPGKLLDFACQAEAVGFDSVFVSDHFQPWKHVDGHAPYSLAWLGALGARTSRVVIGTSVLTPTFRYHPSIVAQAFGTLGAMFPGRVILGIGTGEWLNEVPATGQPWPEIKERFARLREAVTLIRTLWREERVSFEGQYYRTEKATIYDRPDGEVPIYVAAAGALVAKYAGRSGDGFICTSGKKPELYTETLLPKVAEGLALAGARTQPLRPDDGGQGLVRHRPRTGAAGHPALGGAGADAGGEGVGRGSGGNGAPRRRLADRARGEPLDRVDRSGRAYREASAPISIWASVIWCSMRRVPDQERFLKLYGEQVLPKLRQTFRLSCPERRSMIQ